MHWAPKCEILDISLHHEGTTSFRMQVFNCEGTTVNILWDNNSNFYDIEIRECKLPVLRKVATHLKNCHTFSLLTFWKGCEVWARAAQNIWDPDHTFWKLLVGESENMPSLSCSRQAASLILYRYTCIYSHKANKINTWFDTKRLSRNNSECKLIKNSM